MGTRTQERHFHITTSQCFTEESPIFSLNLRPPAFPLKPTDESPIHSRHKWDLESSRLGYSSVGENLLSMHDTWARAPSLKKRKRNNKVERENNLGWAPVHHTPEQLPAPACLTADWDCQGSPFRQLVCRGGSTLLFLVILLWDPLFLLLVCIFTLQSLTESFIGGWIAPLFPAKWD